MSLAEPFLSLEEEVSHTFVQRLHGEWTRADQAALERRLASDSAYAEAYRLAQESFELLSSHADMPEMMKFRERALAHARLSNANRWLGANFGDRNRWRLAAGIAGLTVVLAVAWQLSPWGYMPGRYRTGIGEQRMVELDDHSRIALDAVTRIAIRYTGESRTIELIEGQAQFSVAKDPVRPFKVKVGERTIVALGTVFTVDFTDQQIHVAMMEGRVAVVPDNPQPSPSPSAGNSSPLIPLQRLKGKGPGRREGEETHMRTAGGQGTRTAQRGDEAIELSAGEELRVSEDGHTTLTPKADLEAATAWRNGKVVFKTERLSDAIKRMNRYSRVQLEATDPALGGETLSGVFEAGDTQGFIAGVQLALPVVATHRDSNTVRLSFRQ